MGHLGGRYGPLVCNDRKRTFIQLLIMQFNCRNTKHEMINDSDNNMRGWRISRGLIYSEYITHYHWLMLSQMGLSDNDVTQILGFLSPAPRWVTHQLKSNVTLVRILLLRLDPPPPSGVSRWPISPDLKWPISPSLRFLTSWASSMKTKERFAIILLNKFP